MSLASRLVPVASILTASALLAGCGSDDAGASGSGRQAVAAFYPLAWVTERVAGDGWEVSNLTQPGGEPHDLELGIAQTAALDEADVVVFQHEFQPAVDEAIENVSDAVVVDAAEAVELRSLEEQHEGHDDEHDHGDSDPHFWQDPLLMADLADAVAAELAEVDADGAATYRANAEELRAELEELDAEFSEGLARCERDTVVVSHEAFGYLERYGVHFEGIAGLSPDAEPTPAGLAELEELIASEGITTVFSERLASPAMAESLAADTGVETAVLDPIEGPGDDGDSSDYLALMQQNLEALKQANGC
ncbi:zinc ABC transporter substrate-binding protein [Nocardioides flavus (ex Wang et al. 2016)]|uniref:Zinc ABC transporter substrate-binding protein n=1 Tax=Nocardioides flavus (ex Wang et al. 2016) TaxID=2058780 RepID=A0ABQ3HNW9_9ACTN|nr:metal ABC transporter substrate-binding protein [Nocardioides flavus (ex Wang et al. 2016)]GHE19370.1 zinc ABC transporter substrate-binding protein [Nocardioides flavus (ex Wang et al. 2016)]